MELAFFDQKPRDCLGLIRQTCGPRQESDGQEQFPPPFTSSSLYWLDPTVNPRRLCSLLLSPPPLASRACALIGPPRSRSMTGAFRGSHWESLDSVFKKRGR